MVSVGNSYRSIDLRFAVLVLVDEGKALWQPAAAVHECNALLFYTDARGAAAVRPMITSSVEINDVHPDYRDVDTVVFH